jgi:hypothetical protein
MQVTENSWDSDISATIWELSNDLSAIRSHLSTLKMITGFKQEDLVLCTVCLSNPRAVSYC